MSRKKKPRPEPESLGLPRTGVESHAHLDLEDFDEDREEMLQRAASAGVERIGNVFLGPDAFEAKSGLFAEHPEVFFLLGIHPHDASQCGQEELARMQALFRSEPRLKAWGEIGLDYFYDLSPRDVQIRVFREELQAAKEVDVPVVIHSRDAEEETVDVLLDQGYADRPLLWHCFGKGPDFAAEVLSHGWMLSFPGMVTFPKSTEAREAVAVTPLERMLLETDCPYLTPAPYRGKRNEPAYLGFTAQVVAECKQMETAALWTQCGLNAKKFFKLD